MKSIYASLVNSVGKIVEGLSRIPEGSLLDGVEPGTDGKITVLTIFPHADDETIYSAGTLIKLKKNPKVRLVLLNLTLGEKSPARSRMNLSGGEMARVRQKELRNAARAMSADEVIQFDYPDLGLEKADQPELLRKVLDVIDRAHAKIIVTFSPYGIYGHPDHRTANRVATEAFKKSPAKKLYYVSFDKLYALFRVIMCQFASGAYARLIYYHLKNPVPIKPTIRVDITAEKQMKKAALDAYASQKMQSNLTAFLEMSVVSDYEWFALAAENK